MAEMEHKLASRRARRRWSSDDVADVLGCGTRVLLGVIFGSIAAGFGYGLGSRAGMGWGLLLGGMCFVPAFLIGCCWLEVKLFIRFLIGFWL